MNNIDIQFVHEGRKSLEVDRIPRTKDNLVELVKHRLDISLDDYAMYDKDAENVTDILLKKYRDEDMDLSLNVAFTGDYTTYHSNYETLTGEPVNNHINISFVHDDDPSLLHYYIVVPIDEIPSTKNNLVKLIETRLDVSLGVCKLSDEYKKPITNALLKKYETKGRSLLLNATFIGEHTTYINMHKKLTKEKGNETHWYTLCSR